MENSGGNIHFNVHREKIASNQRKFNINEENSSLPSCFSNSNCSKPFNLGLEKVNKQKNECNKKSKTKNFTSLHRNEISCAGPSNRKGNCVESESKLVLDSKITMPTVESQMQQSHGFRKYAGTNIQNEVLDENLSYCAGKISCRCPSNSSYECVRCIRNICFKNLQKSDLPTQPDKILQIFNNSSSVIEHNSSVRRNNHNIQNPSSDILCNDNIKKKSNVEKQNIEPLDLSVPKCNICQLKFQTKVALKIHMETHDDTNPFMCKLCKKTCSSRWDLASHMRKHSNERPFKCKFCLLGFKSKYRVTIHMTTHSHERPYKCNLCPSTFKLKPYLTKHLE